jgi:poly(A) polymerase
MQFGDVMQMKQSTLKRFLRLPKFEEHLALHRADAPELAWRPARAV